VQSPQPLGLVQRWAGTTARLTHLDQMLARPVAPIRGLPVGTTEAREPAHQEAAAAESGRA